MEHTLELRIPTEAELRRAYREDLETSFPPDELRPLSGILRRWREGTYQPWCLYEAGRGIVGECFLLLAEPGWAVVDYLCVRPDCRNSGFGGWMLREMRRLDRWKGLLGETEDPADAPDPSMAARRLDFYRRSGARLASYDTDLFGVHYKTLYWADGPVDDETLIREHRYAYRLEEMPEYVRAVFEIPRRDDISPEAREAAIQTLLDNWSEPKDDSEQAEENHEDTREPGRET